MVDVLWARLAGVETQKSFYSAIQNLLQARNLRRAGRVLNEGPVVLSIALFAEKMLQVMIDLLLAHPDEVELTSLQQLLQPRGRDGYGEGRCCGAWSVEQGQAYC